MQTNEELEKDKNKAYWERNQLVAALSQIFPAHLAKHEGEWDDEWRTIVVIYLPVETCGLVDTDEIESFDPETIKVNYQGKHWGYQLSWHIHDSDIPMFDHLRYWEYKWDGHSTEEKYRRLRKLKPAHAKYFEFGRGVMPTSRLI